MKATSVELVLEGLDCAVCEVRINEKVNELENVKSASLNYATKILTIELSHEDSKKLVIENIIKIVKKLEPEVSISEKEHEKLLKRTLILEGLDCASCVLKIEDKIKAIDGVKKDRKSVV